MRQQMLHKKLESAVMTLEIESYLKDGGEITRVPSGLMQASDSKKDKYLAKQRIFTIFSQSGQSKWLLVLTTAISFIFQTCLRKPSPSLSLLSEPGFVIELATGWGNKVCHLKKSSHATNWLRRIWPADHGIRKASPKKALHFWRDCGYKNLPLRATRRNTFQLKIAASYWLETAFGLYWKTK